MKKVLLKIKISLNKTYRKGFIPIPDNKREWKILANPAKALAGKIVFILLKFLQYVQPYNNKNTLQCLRIIIIFQNITGINIPGGTWINIQLYVVNIDPDFWSDPDEFEPERFL